MLIRRPPDIKPSEITDYSVYKRRREFLRTAAVAGASVTLGGLGLIGGGLGRGAIASTKPVDLENVVPGPFSTDEEQTLYDDVTSYNNFYELGTDKGDPRRNARQLKTEPWSVVIDGEVGKPGKVTFEDLIRPHAIEERIYRLRCVEAWSMVIPWNGFPLGDLLKRFEPTSSAKYVAFETIHDSEMLPNQRRSILDWPYVEGLRIDEAMHPLTIMGIGLYGVTMPNQNGAPLRLVVPWKYGFKSIKSIVRITLTENEPPTSWNIQNPREYGFYSNVNPEVSHPRWSQRRERRIGEFLKRDTLPFNGYGEQVASLYAGMDLKEFI